MVNKQFQDVTSSDLVESLANGNGARVSGALGGSDKNRGKEKRAALIVDVTVDDIDYHALEAAEDNRVINEGVQILNTHAADAWGRSIAAGLDNLSELLLIEGGYHRARGRSRQGRNRRRALRVKKSEGGQDLRRAFHETRLGEGLDGSTEVTFRGKVIGSAGCAGKALSFVVSRVGDLVIKGRLGRGGNGERDGGAGRRRGRGGRDRRGGRADPEKASIFLDDCDSFLERVANIAAGETFQELGGRQQEVLQGRRLQGSVS